jgi:hypothetical protein
VLGLLGDVIAQMVEVAMGTAAGPFRLKYQRTINVGILAMIIGENAGHEEDGRERACTILVHQCHLSHCSVWAPVARDE